jgi:hypothetical protein
LYIAFGKGSSRFASSELQRRRRRRSGMRCSPPEAESLQDPSRLTNLNFAPEPAIGGTIAAIDAGDYAKGRKVLVVVMTDGRENASKEWTSRAGIAKLVKRREDAGWKFVFFGANIEAFAESESLSIPASRSVQYKASPQGTSDSFRKMSRASRLYAEGKLEKTWVAELSKEEPENN